MKRITVNIPLQFDQYHEKADSLEYTLELIDLINERLEGMTDSPQILSRGLDDSDIRIEGYDN